MNNTEHTIINTLHSNDHDGLHENEHSNKLNSQQLSQAILAGDTELLTTLLELGIQVTEKNNTDNIESLYDALKTHHQQHIATDTKTKTDINTITQIENLCRTFKKFSSSPEFRILHLIDWIFDDILRCPELDPHIQQCLNRLRLTLVLNAIVDLPSVISKSSPFRQYISTINKYCIGWQPQLGHSSKSIIETIEEGINAINSTENSTISFTQENDKLQQQLSKNIKNSDKLEHRLQTSELGLIQTKSAQFQTIKHLNSLITDCMLPTAAAAFIKGPWRDSLQLTYIKYGADSHEWLSIKKLSKTLINSIRPLNTDEQRQQAYKIIPQLSAQITPALISLEHDDETKKTEVETINKLHLMILKQEAIEYLNTSPIPLIQSKKNTEQQVIGATVSHQLKREANRYQPGQWFIYTDENSEVIRCKLALKSESASLLIFVNFIGVKCLQKTEDEFSLQLSSGIFIALENINIFDRAITKIIHQLNKNIIKTDKQKAEQEAKQEIKERALKQSIAEAKEKATAEAKALAEKQSATKKKEQERIRQQALIKEQKIEEIASQKIHSLTLGDWVLFEANTTHEAREAKLAVKLKSSGKYIFVDRIGLKMGEYQHQQLVNMAVNEQLRLLEQSDFENTLIQIIGGQRKI